MEPDFSGWATKNDLLCSDGVTIRSGAFKHMDKKKVPLVWSHQHNDSEMVLGHAILHDRAFGTYTEGFFNETKRGKEAKMMVAHGDVESLSIYANRVKKRGEDVIHGNIVEVSLVLAGANPGAFIDNVYIKHGDSFDTLEGEAIIYTGLELRHGADPDQEEIVTKTATDETVDLTHADDEETIGDVLDTFDEKQANVLDYLVGQALAEGRSSADGDIAQSALPTKEEQTAAREEFLAHIDSSIESKIKEGFTDMTNVFETHGKIPADAAARKVLSHSELETIFTDAEALGSLEKSIIKHAEAGSYGIDDIDFLFPDAKALSATPELLARRTEWVAKVLDGTKHSPFSRIKSIVADITADEARAKGYVKGNLKKDEIIKLLKRVTTPTTVYKKQKLDRDDIVDITDFDVVAWLKAEMRLMLDEEIARAVLIGDGREVDDEDKIDEDHLRPIAFDADMYAHKVNLASNVSPEDVVEAVLRSRTYYKGTGTPTLFTTDSFLTDMLLIKDKMNRRIYETEASLAAALRVKEIVVVEVMESATDVLAIIVNLTDYTIGADKGGAISMFDDFDIDYNQQKYLIETRISGALTKPKSAVVIKRSAGTLVTPTQPTYNSGTHVLTIPAVTGVIYSIDGVDKTAGNITITETTEVEARPAATYAFAHNIDTDWVYIF